MLKLTVFFLIMFSAASVQAELFHLKSDGTVADLGSGLLWQGTSQPAVSAGEAIQLCQQKSAKVSSSWRLPSAQELTTLERHLDQLTPSTYWIRSETLGKGAVYCFGDGAIFTQVPGNFPAQVRCVADDPLAPAVEAFRLWAEAWKAADIGAYLSSYAPDYQPARGMSHEDWVTQRKQRLARAGQIELFLSPEEVREMNNHQVELIFQQTYKSPRYQDKVRKRILMIKENGRWLIAREEQLASLPPEQLSTSYDFY